ncbi:MAG: membrane-bound lytic murein transglycosylase B [Candidatus Azotimanducaceae bacterium]|jgi:membrane-bound lytic murein transglycosylase B
MRRFVWIVGIWMCSAGAIAENPPFQQWLAGIQAQARVAGVSESTIALLNDLEPDPRVLKFDSRQPEFTQTFEEYLASRVTQYRIDTAKKYYVEHRDVLERIAADYEVDASYLVAFWGVESNFGTYQGKYSIIRSLATLGHDERRSAFFTKELMTALTILDEGHIEADKFVGGWAGAMGQNQFMPSSFLNYAEDYDNDGQKNIWSNTSDVWASIANYLKKNRWRQNSSWGVAVTLTAPIDFEALRPAKVRAGCRAYRHHTKVLSVADWQAKGVKVPEGVEGKFSMVIPEPDETKAYFVGPNFGGILAYNCANKYAVSVGLLADQIESVATSSDQS